MWEEGSHAAAAGTPALVLCCGKLVLRLHHDCTSIRELSEPRRGNGGALLSTRLAVVAPAPLTCAVVGAGAQRLPALTRSRYKADRRSRHCCNRRQPICCAVAISLCCSCFGCALVWPVPAPRRGTTQTRCRASLPLWVIGHNQSESD